MIRLYLQNIVNDIPFEDLPATWQGFDFVRFSKDKTLFVFQRNALENAVKALYLYFKVKNADKQALFKHYELNGFVENFDYDLKKKQDSKALKYLLEYPADYPVVNNRISFAHFINRMSFWMATGSGKTLVIVKLAEILGKLIAEKELPEGDILFLTYRDDLLHQFKKHVEEFNRFSSTKINLKNLREYEKVKRESILPFTKNEVTVFYYRSDLISDESKEKTVSYKDYDNNGGWYILLDEAHKGDKDDSKRQIIYSILSRNRFLFNFSATFTDPRDFATCVFKFNLSEFVEQGYGKHIYVSKSDVSAFKGKDDFSAHEKQKMVLKALLLLSYINKQVQEIRKINNTLYHRPLLLTLVNSVNEEESDLELFFRELEKVARKEIKEGLLEQAKDELIREFIKDNPVFEFEGVKFQLKESSISELGYEDILRYVFNAEKPGQIEVLKISSNKNELIFKLTTTDRPFALIKIGDISEWLKNKLKGYIISQSFDNESYFMRINQDDSDVNILMGSRSFYEGWDSNRPNVILFINIGVGNEAKKFVLQSIGRGVRIEPIKGKRKRLENLINESIADKQLENLFNTIQLNKEVFSKIKEYNSAVETLFVFGTKAENLKEIINLLREEKQDKDLGDLIEINPKVNECILLVPVYKTTEKIIAEEKEIPKFIINEQDFTFVKRFYEYIGDKIALVKYDCQIATLKKVKESLEDKNKSRYYIHEGLFLGRPELILGKIFDYFEIKSMKFEKFKELEEEIVHFKRIRFSDGEKYEEIRNKIEKIKRYPEEQKRLDEQYGKISREEFERRSDLLKQAGNFEMKGKKINIKYIANHYYIPVILSEQEKIDYINHIINVPSEVKFIEELEEYLKKSDNMFKQFDWWMFSKIDERVDKVFIPYYNPKDNRIAEFKPDFIFWMRKGNRYWIIFIDPKGTEHREAYTKIDGFSRIFEDAEKQSKKFSYDGLTIEVKLFLKAEETANVPEKYRAYWFSNLHELEDKLKSLLETNMHL